MKSLAYRLAGALCLCLGLFATAAYGQAIEAWVARYNGATNLEDGAKAVAVDGSGNTYVTGWSHWGGADYDYITAKYDPDGYQVWWARYDGPAVAWDQAFAIAVDDLGNVYVTGGSTGVAEGVDYATVKYDTNGNQQWVARYDGPYAGGGSTDEANAIAVDVFGNVYVTGWSVGAGNQSDYATVKYNSSGVELWVARYDGPNGADDDAVAIAVHGSGNVYVTGTVQRTWPDYDYATVKYNSNGAQQWVMLYNGLTGLADQAAAIAVTPGEFVHVTGTSEWGPGDTDYITVQYASNGTQMWVARYDGPPIAQDAAAAITVDGWGNVYVTGGSVGSGGNYDYATVKYNANGSALWVQRYDGPASSMPDIAHAIAVDAALNVTVTGESNGSGTGRDYATIRYDHLGNQMWLARYNGPLGGADEAYAVALDADGNVHVTGASQGVGTDYDYATIKYVPSLDVKLVPDATTIPRGGTLGFTAYVTNNANSAQDVTFWTNVTLANGSTYPRDGRLIGPIGGRIGAHITRSGHFAHRVPLDAPLGTFTYNGYVGPGYPTAWDRDAFAFAVVSAQEAAGPLTAEALAPLNEEGIAREGIDLPLLENTLFLGEAATTALSGSPAGPRETALLQNVPNPFNPSTTITYVVGAPGSGEPAERESAAVLLQVFNLRGELVKTLVEAPMPPGTYTVFWDGRDGRGTELGSGVYLLRLQANGKSATRKIVLLK